MAAVFLLGTLLTAQQKTAETTQTLHFTHGMTVQALAGHGDAEMVVLPSGHTVSVGLLRHMDSAMRAVHAPPTFHPPLGFTLKPAVTGAPVRNAVDLAQAMNTMKDTDTVQLPSGRRVTIAQIKLLAPMVERQSGHKLSVAPAPVNLNGPTIKISPGTTKAAWQAILAKPDNTILESPTGVKVTVGGIKQYLAATPGFPLGEGSMVKASAGRTPSSAPQIQRGRPQ